MTESSEQAEALANPHILIISAPYYEDVAALLLEGATGVLDARGIGYELVTVAGALEIPQAFAAAVEAGAVPRRSPVEGRFDGVVVLGCVIRGETSHYDVVVNNTNHWLMDIAISEAIPVGNAILTVDTKEQAMKRANGREGKGGDAARACAGLIELQRGFLAERDSLWADHS
jgi:6,7-dimethyl-8-ribityllumazine synthase